MIGYFLIIIDLSIHVSLMREPYFFFSRANLVSGSSPTRIIIRFS